VDFPSWMVASIDREAHRLGVTRQSLSAHLLPVNACLHITRGHRSGSNSTDLKSYRRFSWSANYLPSRGGDFLKPFTGKKWQILGDGHPVHG
jgi:hypothetical protein